jgi:hypothetical protein
VQVVVVEDERLDHLLRPGEPGARADEDELGAGGDEPVDEILGEDPVDLGDLRGAELEEVPPRVEDVDVDPVLMGGVSEPAEALAEVASVGPAEIGDPDPRRAGIRRPVLGDHRECDRDRPPGRPAPPGPVGDPAERKVPGEEVGALRRELDAADQRSPLGGAERDRARIGGALLDLLEASGGCRGGGDD